MSRTRVALDVVMLLLVACARMDAQATPVVERATLRLHVVGANDMPISDAEVRLDGARSLPLARTDSLGDARFELPVSGLLRATIRRLGYGPARIDLRVATGDNVLIVRLDRATATLDAVRIVGSRLTVARLDDFEQRRLRGDASATVTQEQIEHRGPIALTQMLRDIPGIRITDSSGNRIAMSKRSLKVLRDLTLAPCIMRVTVDGVVMPALSNIDAIVPKDVYGIEVFNGPARLPPQLNGLRTDNWCGLIAIWTRAQ